MLTGVEFKKLEDAAPDVFPLGVAAEAHHEPRTRQLSPDVVYKSKKKVENLEKVERSKNLFFLYEATA